MGCFVGLNEGTIRNCRGGDWLYGSCNMGTIAGSSSGIISDCDAGSNMQDICVRYHDYNACLGGIVGIQTDGQITDNHFQGSIYMKNYSSDKYNKQSEDREMQMCAGIIVGYKQKGFIQNNTYNVKNENTDTEVVYADNFYVVTWKTGWWLWEETHTHNQGLYFKNAICGRED